MFNIYVFNIFRITALDNSSLLQDAIRRAPTKGPSLTNRITVMQQLDSELDSLQPGDTLSDREPAAGTADTLQRQPSKMAARGPVSGRSPPAVHRLSPAAHRPPPGDHRPPPPAVRPIGGARPVAIDIGICGDHCAPLLATVRHNRRHICRAARAAGVARWPAPVALRPCHPF